MAREIITGTGKFPPSVTLKEKGEYIKGKVLSTRSLPVDAYGHIRPCISLELIDMQGGSTQVFVAKGEYQEVEVSPGDVVDFVGRGTILRGKIPQLQIGDIVTITNDGLGKAAKGRKPPKLFKVMVE